MITLPRLMILLVVILTSWLLVIAMLWHFADDSLRWQTGYWQAQYQWFLVMNLWSTVFWGNVTYLGDAVVLLPFVVLLFMRLQPQICAAIIAALPFGVVVTIAKKLLAVPRPAFVLENDSFLIVGESLAGHTSLPSGHSVTVFTTLGIICFSVARLPTAGYGVSWIIGLSCALVVALSRVFVGAHWPLDVFFGATLGVFFAASAVLFTETYRGWWRWLSNKKNYIWISLGLAIWCVALVVRALETTPSLSITLWAAALACVIAAIGLLRSRFFVSCRKISI